MTGEKSVQCDKGMVIPKRHAELVSASYQHARFAFNPINKGLDYYVHGYLDPETSSG